jgi:hypothetical protein
MLPGIWGGVHHGFRKYRLLDSGVSPTYLARRVTLSQRHSLQSFPRTHPRRERLAKPPLSSVDEDLSTMALRSEEGNQGLAVTWVLSFRLKPTPRLGMVVHVNYPSSLLVSRSTTLRYVTSRRGQSSSAPGNTALGNIQHILMVPSWCWAVSRLGQRGYIAIGSATSPQSLPASSHLLLSIFLSTTNHVAPSFLCSSGWTWPWATYRDDEEIAVDHWPLGSFPSRTSLFARPT